MMRRPPRSALFPYTTLSRSLLARRRRDRPPAWRAVAFASGVAVLLLSLVSPLDTLAHEYLFSAHMAQHLLLTLVVPPLLLDRKSTRLKLQSRQYIVCRLLL